MKGTVNMRTFLLAVLVLLVTGYVHSSEEWKLPIRTDESFVSFDKPGVLNLLKILDESGVAPDVFDRKAFDEEISKADKFRIQYNEKSEVVVRADKGHNIHYDMKRLMDEAKKKRIFDAVESLYYVKFK